MNWYYVESGNRVGPFDDAEFERLVRAGTIRSETLVWSEGMTEWRRYGELGTSGAEAPLGVATAACAECGRTFSTESMIRHGSVWVCAGCKPVFLQKLREGVETRKAEFRYGGFWMRVLAYFVDQIVLGLAIFVLYFVAFFALATSARGRADERAALALSVVLAGLQILIVISYETWMVGKFGATLGKMACGLRVVMSDGSKVSYMRALGRWFGKVLSGLIFGIGFLMVAFDPEKRGLHDRICETRVVYQ